MIKLFLIKKLVSSKDIEKWLSWLNDENITKFSDKRFKKHTKSSQNKFLKKKINEKNSYIFQIKFKNKFIGVIELSSVNILNKGCEISYMIGEKKMHGKVRSNSRSNFTLLGLLKHILTTPMINGVVAKRRHRFTITHYSIPL